VIPTVTDDVIVAVALAIMLGAIELVAVTVCASVGIVVFANLVVGTVVLVPCSLVLVGVVFVGAVGAVGLVVSLAIALTTVVVIDGVIAALAGSSNRVARKLALQVAADKTKAVAPTRNTLKPAVPAARRRRQ